MTEDNTDIEEFKCDCTNRHSSWDHEMECSLWDCWAFEKGLAWWDESEDRLILLSAEEMNDNAIDLEDPDVQRLIQLHEVVHDIGLPEVERIVFGPNQAVKVGDMAAVDEVLRTIVEGRIDNWVDDKTEHPKNFSYRGATWVWNPDESTWIADKLGCYCGHVVLDPDATSCKDCQVIRSSKHSNYWRQSVIRGKEVTCRCSHAPAWQCIQCGVMRVKEHHPWQINPLTKSKNQNQKLGGGAVDWNNYGTGTGNYGYIKDRHYGTEVVMPDGVKFWASSQHTRSEGDPLPDFGFYLDKAWTPQCLAIYCPWTDYGLPQLAFNRVVEGIKAIHGMAKNGQIVEVGCIGGHGRTGTVLACLAVLSGVAGDKAVEWVQTTYCKHAVESEVQEWFVLWFDATLRGVEPPEKPKPKPSTVTYGTAAADKGKNEGRIVKLTQDQYNIMYCGECMTDCTAEQQKAREAAQCYWCLGTFGTTEDVAAWKAANPNWKPKSDKPHLKAKNTKKGGKSGPKASKLPSHLQTLRGDKLHDALVRWVEDRLWPKDRVKVMQVDGFHCSHCKDAVSWRFSTEQYPKSGWVHRSKVHILLEDCESSGLEYGQCWWNLARDVRESEKRHDVKLIPVTKEDFE